MGSQWRVLIGCNYPRPGGKDEVRHEPGDIVDSIPSRVVDALIGAGAIEAYPPPPPGALSVAPEAGALSLTEEAGRLSVVGDSRDDAHKE